LLNRFSRSEVKHQGHILVKCIFPAARYPLTPVRLTPISRDAISLYLVERFQRNLEQKGFQGQRSKFKVVARPDVLYGGGIRFNGGVKAYSLKIVIGAHQQSLRR